MWYNIHMSKPRTRTKLEEIESALKRELASRRYPQGERLPGENVLAESFGAARETVRKAIASLVAQGLVAKRQGAGTFATGRGQRRSGTFGLFVPDFESVPFFADMESRLARLCKRIGYRIVLADASAGASAEAMRRKARELAVARVEGVLFRPALDERSAAANREVVRIFRRVETPVVLLDGDICSAPERSDCDLVAVDNVGAGRRIALHLVARGRRRVAFLMSGKSIGPNDNWRNRLFGLAGELAVLGVCEGVRTLAFKPDDADAVRRLMSSRAAPDAIVCGNDETAALLALTLRSYGADIPGDVAIVGFDDASVARSSVPPLTTIRQPSELIAKTALKTLLQRIRFPQSDPRTIFLDAPLVERRSS